MTVATPEQEFVRVPSWHGEDDQSFVGSHRHWIDVKKDMGLNWDLVRRPRTDSGAERWIDIVRTDTGEVVHPAATDSFRLITMDEFGFYVEESLRDNKVIWDTFHVFRNGAEFAASIKLDEPLEVKGDKSVIYPFVGFSNRVDGKGSLRAFFAMSRLACYNMVTAQLGGAEDSGMAIRFSHSRKFSMEKAIESTSFLINREREFAHDFADKASVLNQKKIDTKVFVDRWLPTATDMTPRQLENVDTKRGTFYKALNGKYNVGRSDTAWGVLQAAIESYQYDFPVKGNKGRERRGFDMMRPDQVRHSALTNAYEIVLDMSKN